VELVRLTDSAYQLRGGSNAGLIVQDGRAVLVDTGLDRDTAKKILRAIEGQGAHLLGVVITHAHADHFGGAATVRARTGAPVYASKLEAAVIANPILEPLYLFSGAAPAAELRHKFTLAEPCTVDHVIGPGELIIGDIAVRVLPAPGHAPEQVMVGGGGACYVGDACFAPDVFAKHGVPFYTDVDQAATTLGSLRELDGHYAAFVPGHGAAVTVIRPLADENLTRLGEIRKAVSDSLRETDDPATIVQLALTRLRVTVSDPVIFWLMRTTVFACLSALQSAGRASVDVSENRLRWRGSVDNVHTPAL
jgi:glyoxylase-like metal-dependent hydrolase (beta-lactamase superfamily II)